MNKNFLLGVPKIDHQHRELFRSFQLLLSIGTSEEAVSDALSRLTIQIHEHFKTEENFMASLNIPAAMFLQHEQAHTQIVEELTEIHLEIMHGLGVPFEEIINRVAAYVNHHVLEFDLLIKPYIQQRA
jgi:hemerythrin-like metal-binding protein